MANFKLQTSEDFYTQICNLFEMCAFDAVEMRKKRRKKRDTQKFQKATDKKKENHTNKNTILNEYENINEKRSENRRRKYGLKSVTILKSTRVNGSSILRMDKFLLFSLSLSSSVPLSISLCTRLPHKNMKNNFQILSNLFKFTNTNNIQWRERHFCCFIENKIFRK